MLALEGSPGLDEGGPLLLELSLRLLACDPFLPELLFRRGEGGSLSTRLVLSCSTSLDFSSAWLCQARAPSRVAQSYWSWA
jgi:hypothetical protein